MMETLKRHVFLVGLVAGVVVVSLGVILAVYFVYTRPGSTMRQQIRSTKQRAEALLAGQVYTPELVTEMARQVDLRKKQYEDLINYIRGLGKARKPLVQDLFPNCADVNLRHTVKSAYDDAIMKFMKRLSAMAPLAPEKAGDAGALRAEPQEGVMYASPKVTFVRPEWVEKAEAPTPQECRIGQENIWLMEDLVDILAKMNADLAPGNTTLAGSPIKELLEIRLGSEAAVLANSKMPSLPTGRYVPDAPTATGRSAAKPGEKAEVPRAATLAGRWSQSGFYRILPWRMTVVVESRYAGELIRRLKGAESFLSVDAVRERPVTDVSFDRSRDLLAPDRKAYGNRGIVRLEIVGESIIFDLEGGRVTVPPATPPAAPKTPASRATEPQG